MYDISRLVALPDGLDLLDVCKYHRHLSAIKAKHSSLFNNRNYRPLLPWKCTDKGGLYVRTVTGAPFRRTSRTSDSQTNSIDTLKPNLI